MAHGHFPAWHITQQARHSSARRSAAAPQKGAPGPSSMPVRSSVPGTSSSSSESYLRRAAGLAAAALLGRAPVSSLCAHARACHKAALRPWVAYIGVAWGRRNGNWQRRRDACCSAHPTHRSEGGTDEVCSGQEGCIAGLGPQGARVGQVSGWSSTGGCLFSLGSHRLQA